MKKRKKGNASNINLDAEIMIQWLKLVASILYAFATFIILAQTNSRYFDRFHLSYPFNECASKDENS